MLPIAVDAMGGDRAPAEIVAGARQAAEAGHPVVLVGDPARLGDTGGLEVIAASEVIEMHDDPAKGVRTKKDSSLVRAAEAVRDGRASAMVSAGNTGATMASALLRMGRLKGLARPAIATPIPVPGTTPTVVLDAGANAECAAAWLVQFAQMGSVFASQRYGIERPRVGLLSIGEEDGKGNPLTKEAGALLRGGAAGPAVDFIGNVEGRDVMTDTVDVVVTDGFTGNVVLKTLEGAMRFAMRSVLASFETDDETRAAGTVLLPALLPFAAEMDPDTTGGAVLLGVKGVCVISHGSSSATAIVNAVGVAAAAVADGLVDRLAGAITPIDASPSATATTTTTTTTDTTAGKEGASAR
ncbi:MAG TPA: phosphate acyltransferase PlsX [Acidimicrobiales bacterium]|nr:phosphate acyltransferase PlsX [Acidimicrobiales bacterium]